MNYIIFYRPNPVLDHTHCIIFHDHSHLAHILEKYSKPHELQIDILNFNNLFIILIDK